jgi:ubiquinone biosynthesis protein
VQRPDIREGIAHDLEALMEIARFFDSHTEIGRKYEFERIMAQLRKSLIAELDYRQEARHLALLRDNLRSFERIVVPRPIDDFTTMRVLTMEYVSGRKITDLSPVALIEIDRCGLAEELSSAYLKQMLVDGFFHADPHPGNVLLSDDGRLVLLDLGMVSRLSPRLQESLVKLLLAISEGRGEDAAQIALELAEEKDDANREEFLRRGAEFVSRHQDARLQDIQAGRVVIEFHSIAAENGIRMPSEFAMIGKALLNLDMVTRALDPKFDPNASIRRNAANMLSYRMKQNLSPGKFFSSILEASEFAQRLPERLNRILERVSKNELKVEIDAIDEDALICGLQKIANRICVGLILAALIIGAALIMRIETPFEIMGYPGLAILLFAFAAVGGIGLVINIWRSDR